MAVSTVSGAIGVLEDIFYGITPRSCLGGMG